MTATRQKVRKAIIFCLFLTFPVIMIILQDTNKRNTLKYDVPAPIISIYHINEFDISLAA